MMNLQSKMTVYAAIAAMLALMGGIVYYSSLDNPYLEQVEVELVDVQVVSVNEFQNKATLEVTFLVTNPTERTFTVPSITYDLYSNGRLVSPGHYSTEDIAMPGRAAFYGGASIPLDNRISISPSAENAGLYDDIVNAETNPQRLGYSASGIITVETAWALVEKEFETNMS